MTYGINVSDIATCYKLIPSSYLMSTSFIKIKTNLDIYSADWRPINLEKAPFNFPKPIITINEECNEMNGIYSDKSICLWKIKDLPHFNI